MSTIAILWPVKAIFEKRAATVEVHAFISPERIILRNSLREIVAIAPKIIPQDLFLREPFFEGGG